MPAIVERRSRTSTRNPAGRSPPTGSGRGADPSMTERPAECGRTRAGAEPWCRTKEPTPALYGTTDPMTRRTRAATPGVAATRLTRPTRSLFALCVDRAGGMPSTEPTDSCLGRETLSESTTPDTASGRRLPRLTRGSYSASSTPRLRTKASIASRSTGTSRVRILQPSAVTTTTSSIRIPIPVSGS